MQMVEIKVSEGKTLHPTVRMWTDVPHWDLPEGTEKSHEKSQSGQLISGLRFEPRTS
jgi:hypothetical protein